MCVCECVSECVGMDVCKCHLSSVCVRECGDRCGRKFI